jgi:hypothetical protein
MIRHPLLLSMSIQTDHSESNSVGQKYKKDSVIYIGRLCKDFTFAMVELGGWAIAWGLLKKSGWVVLG